MRKRPHREARLIHDYRISQRALTLTGSDLAQAVPLVAGCYREDMRREADFFDDRELRLLFMARRLRDALRLEELLTHSGIDYCVETGDYEAGIIFKRDLTGAFFYVDPGDLVRSQQLLVENRFKPYEPRPDRRQLDEHR